MRELNLEEIQAIELDILTFFADICERHGLDYFLAYGTLIGAMRHEGFIPWDDDIDVCMPRADYEKLWEVSREEEFAPYQLVSYRDKSSLYSFFKLVDTRTLVHETYIADQYETGLWIDVFPLDACEPDSAEFAEAKKANNRLQQKLELAVGDASRSASTVGKVAKTLLKPYIKHMDPYAISAEMDKLAAGLDDSTRASGEVRFYAEMPDAVGMGDLPLPAENLFPTTFASFEGKQLRVPCDADAILTLWYKSWRKVPAPEDRPASHALDVFWVAEEPFDYATTEHTRADSAGV